MRRPCCHFGQALIVVGVVQKTTAFRTRIPPSAVSLSSCSSMRNVRWSHRLVQPQPQPKPQNKCLQTSTCIMLASTADDNDNDGDDADGGEYEWQVGNVYDDIDKLDLVMKIQQAEDHLQQINRRHMLENFARQRRPIRPDLIRFVIAPIIMIMSMTLLNKRRLPLLCMLQRGLDLHFWSIVVASPLALLLTKKRAPYQPMPVELERIEPEYRQFVAHLFDWEDPRKSCRDVVLSLLENWISSIAGVAVLGMLLLISKQPRPSLLSAMVITLTRLGAIASLHQYPKLLYELRRQPLPLERDMFRMQRLMRFVMYAAPLGVVSDLSKVFSLLPFRFTNPPLNMGFLMTMPFLLAAIGPIIHLIAIGKLFRIQKTHDISLSTDADTLESIMSCPNEMAKRTKWRYRLHWREPQRFADTIPGFLDSIVYQYVFQNTVSDKFMKESRESMRRAADDKREEKIANSMRGNKQLVPSSEWKPRAMEALAKEHQRDYDSGEFKDPLGVAIQQTFGIGLAYGFDHMTPLPEGEEPTSRRLQARIAKSAIRRVQTIYDAEVANRELRQVIDPSVRELKKQELRQRSEAEVKYLKDALTTLVPVDESNPIPVQIFREKKVKKVSPKKFLIVEEDVDVNETVDNVTQKMRHNLNDEPRDSALLWKNNPEAPDNDDEFMAALKKKGRFNESDEILS